MEKKILVFLFLVFVVVGSEDVKKSTFNFASFEAGAKIKDKSNGMKKVNSILNEDKDSYLLFPVDLPKKYFVVQLSEEILMSSLTLINHEFYSSFIKTFQVFGTTKFEDKQWNLFGEFKTNERKNENTFFLSKPTITRYIKINVIDHHGDESFCTLTTLRVQGLTLLEDLKEETIEPSYNKCKNNVKHLFFDFIKEKKDKKPKNILKTLLHKSKIFFRFIYLVKKQEKITENMQNELRFYKMNYNLVKKELIRLKHSYFKKFHKEMQMFNHTFTNSQQNLLNKVHSVKYDLIIYILIGIFLLLIVQLLLYFKNFVKMLKSLFDLSFKQLFK